MGQVGGQVLYLSDLSDLYLQVTELPNIISNEQ